MDRVCEFSPSRLIAAEMRSSGAGGRELRFDLSGYPGVNPDLWEHKVSPLVYAANEIATFHGGVEPRP